jgi:hypothetical protein
LWKMHDLHSNEANAEDGVRLIPSGTQIVLSVKSQQHAMQCDALADEIRLVLSFSAHVVLFNNVVPSPNFFALAVRTLQSF